MWGFLNEKLHDCIYRQRNDSETKLTYKKKKCVIVFFLVFFFGFLSAVAKRSKQGIKIKTILTKIYHYEIRTKLNFTAGRSLSKQNHSISQIVSSLHG